MIRTDKQLKATKLRVREFEEQLIELKAKMDMDPILYELEESSLLSMLGALREEIHDYELLTSKDCKSLIFDSFEVSDLPDMLIKARLVRKMSQGDLGKKIGVDAQAIQRYEANGYDGVGFERLLEIQYALSFDIQCKGQIINNDIFDLGEACNAADIEAKERDILTHNIFSAKASI